MIYLVIPKTDENLNKIKSVGKRFNKNVWFRFDGGEMKSKIKEIISLTALAILTILLGIFLFFGLGIAYRVYEYKNAFKDVKFIAHRGLCSKYFENSEEAFVAAGKSDFFYGIETDVYFTEDGVPVCVHNDKAFDETDVSVTELTFEQIKELPLKKDLNGFSGNELCLFEKYLSICSDYEKIAVIELKQWNLTKEQISELICMAKSVCDNDFIMISFNKNHIKTVKEIDRDIKTQHIVSYVDDFFNSLNEGFDVSGNEAYIKESVLKEVCDVEKGIGIWTVNDINEAKKYAECGVDYITTNKDLLSELKFV